MSRPVPGPRRRFAGLLAGLAVSVAAVASVGMPAGHAAIAPAGTAPTVSADALPTVQVNGVVWKTAVVRTTVYAVGSFSRARPAGRAAGDPAEVPRANILAFDLETGAMLPFAPVLNAQALTVRASPDGSTLYVGGDFTTIDNQVRSKVAAFDTATGALTGFAPALPAQVRALAVTGTTVYAGGVFGNVGTATRHRLAAFSRSTGALLPWAPSADDDLVEALIAAPGGKRIVVGGRFQSLNGLPHVGIAAVDGVTGATLPWSSRPIPARSGPNRSWVTDLVASGGVVYGGADGEGQHWFDGRFAANLATGDLVWLDNCYGATYGVFASGPTLYSASHAHDCSSLGAFPQTTPGSYYRALAETTAAIGLDQTPAGTNSAYTHQPVPGLLTWFPNINIGTFTGQNQGAWAVTGTKTYVVMGGEFTRVNGIAQQGLVRFAVTTASPDKVGPVFSSTLPPRAFSPRAGVVRIAWLPTWDPDNATLHYELFRDFGTTAVFSANQTSSGWTTSYPSAPTGPAMGFYDTAVTIGSSHTYRLKVSDTFGNNLDNMRTPAVSVAVASPGPYASDVVADGATAYWRLGEPGNTAYDSAGFHDAAKDVGVSPDPAGAINADPDGAAAFNGSPSGLVASRGVLPAPSALTVEAWVRTTSTAGGKIVGYGSAASGSSGSYDRQLYMEDSGNVDFGVFNDGGPHVVRSPTALNDGAYHHLVGTLDPAAGMTLTVDGAQVGIDATTTVGQAYPGYWRIGGDALAGWPRQPTSSYLAGSIDEVAIYPSALAPAVVLRHYADSGRVGPGPAGLTHPG